MLQESSRFLIGTLQRCAFPLDPIHAADAIGDARFVLLGECTYGIDEFHRFRCDLTKRLLEKKGFRAVAIDAGFSEAYRVNRYVQGRGEDPDGKSALSRLYASPPCRWRNSAVVDFVEWLRRLNHVSGDSKGFYGLVRPNHSLYDSVTRLAHRLARSHSHPKLIVWAPNTSIGDSSATDFGEWNLGARLRREHGVDAFLVGFTAYAGMLPKALEGSIEAVFHETKLGSFWLTLRNGKTARRALDEIWLERSQGTEYVHARVAEQFDAVVFVDDTHAVTPLDVDESIGNTFCTSSGSGG